MSLAGLGGRSGGGRPGRKLRPRGAGEPAAGAWKQTGGPRPGEPQSLSTAPRECDTPSERNPFGANTGPVQNPPCSKHGGKETKAANPVEVGFSLLALRSSSRDTARCLRRSCSWRLRPDTGGEQGRGQDVPHGFRRPRGGGPWGVSSPPSPRQVVLSFCGPSPPCGRCPGAWLPGSTSASALSSSLTPAAGSRSIMPLFNIQGVYAFLLDP